MVRDHDSAVKRLFEGGSSYREIGETLGIPLGTAASTCRRLGLVRGTGNRKPRPKIGAAERAERLLDQRDLDILCDLQEGHSQADCAAFWRVPKSHVQKLHTARGTT
jgi:hypothetical protein